MKKIILILTLLVIITGAAFAADDQYEVVITLEGTEDFHVDLDSVKFMIWNGETRWAGGLRGKGSGFGYDDGVVVDYYNNRFIVKTKNLDDMTIILTDDQGNTGYFIQETIKKSEFEVSRRINRVISFDQLDKVSFKNNITGQVDVCLYNTSTPFQASGDALRYSWQAVPKTGKKVYLSRGMYDVVIMQDEIDNVTIYDLDQLNSRDGSYLIKAFDDFSRTYKLDIPASYRNYKYLNINGYLEFDEIFNHYHELRTNHLTLTVDTFLFPANVWFYITDTEHSIYEKSLSLGDAWEISLADQMYYYELPTSSYGNGDVHLDTIMKDYNGNKVTPLGVDIGKDSLMTIYDGQGQEVASMKFSSYWDVFNVDLDKSAVYTVMVQSINNHHVSNASKFRLAFDHEEPKFEFLELVLEDFQGLASIDSVYDDGMFDIDLSVYNVLDKTVTYEVYSVGKKRELLDTLEVGYGKEKTASYQISLNEVTADMDKAIEIRLDGKLVLARQVAGDPAEDIGGHWAESVMNKLLLKNIIFNRYEGEFKPNDQITRGEFSAFLSLALNLRERSGAKSFLDVDEEHALYQYVRTASSNGLIGGYPDGDFKPDNNIKRQDLAIIIKRGLLLKGVRLPQDEMFDQFVDGEAVDGYAMDGVNYCLSNKLLTGKPGNKIDPQAYLTRAEAAVVIERVLKYLE